jgi:hypothetical protein
MAPHGVVEAGPRIVDMGAPLGRMPPKAEARTGATPHTVIAAFGRRGAVAAEAVRVRDCGGAPWARGSRVPQASGPR